MLSNLLSELYNSGVRVVLENDKLLVQSSKGKVSKELLEKIKKNKPELIKYLQGKDYNVEFNKINKAVTKEFYSLSSAQKRLYLLQQMDLNSTAYNMPYVIPLGSGVDKEKIEEVFHQLISRHESFRTSFTIEGEEPVQRIHEQVEFKLEEISIEKDEVENQRHQFVQAFDLSRAPLLRVSKVNVKGESSLLMIDMHHIISDGVSQAILEQDFRGLYSGETLDLLSLQYKDYSEWQNSEEQQVKAKEQEDYWIRKFEEEIPVLDLPADYVRPVMQSNEGATVNFALSREETLNIKTLAKENGLTLYMSVLSVFNILLSKLSGQEDVVVGMPIAGRNHPDLENIVGVFVNTLALRNEVNGNNTLKEFLGKLKQSTLEAFENRDYQFEDLVDKIFLSRDAGRNPVFDVMFNLQNQTGSTADLPGFESNNYVHEPSVSKFDLTLTATDYGEQLLLSFEYCTKLFKAETIERFIEYFKQVVSQIPLDLDRKLSELEIISEEEKQQLLYEFNDTQTAYPKDKTIHVLFEEQVIKNPDRIVAEKEDLFVSYKELNKKSNQIASRLLEMGIGRGTVVGIMLERSEVLIASILGVLKTGAAYLPLNNNWPGERIKFMLSDTCCSVIIQEKEPPNLTKKKCKYLDVSDETLGKENTANPGIKIESSGTIYIIYTSGTTGTPKGILTSHSNVSRVVLNTSYISIKKEDKILQLSSYTFDGSVFDIYGALLNGSSLIALSNEDILSVNILLKIISRKQISIFFLTTALFNTIVDYGMSHLKDVRKMLFGGERISKQHTSRAIQELGEEKLIHVYGPTETTVFASYHNIKQHDIEKGIIPIGKPLSNTALYVLDKHMQLIPKGAAGEIYIGGRGNARGYLNNQELTSERFVNNPYKAGDILYKAGDLGWMLPDGSIEFIDRVDSQVKIRGFRIELGEIESVLQKHESIKESVVLAREDKGEKYLCAYLTIEESIKEEKIRTYLSSSLPDYMIPSYFVELDSLPLTTNGKVNRKALPTPEVKAGDDYVAPANATEKKLVEIWSQVLNLEKEDISTTADFFAIGGHSLKASVLTGKIHKETGVEIPLRDVFLHSSIKAQACQIEKSTRKDFVSIPKAKTRDYYPQSPAQKRLYLLHQIDLSSTAYNMPYTIPLGAGEGKEKIEEVFRQLIKRHESFRTSFEVIGEEPVQRIHEQVGFKVEELTIEKSGGQDTWQQFIQPFDLSQAPLLRAAVVEIKGEGSLLMIDMHHIISDGVSQAILEREFQGLYAGEELAPLSLQYKDYSQWQNSKEQRQKKKDQELYWLNKFGGEIPVLDLPIDYARPVLQSYEGANVSFVLSKEETQHIKRLAKENDLTLYMSILSVFNILLSKLSGQEDIVIGTPIAGRNHSDLENIVGMFINTIPVRNNVGGNQTLKEFIKTLKQETLNSYENQEYQFEELVEKIIKNRDVSRNPLFDVVFNLLNQTGYDGDISSLTNRGLKHVPGTSKFDLTLNAVDYGEQLLFHLEYCTKLFKTDTIERFINYFKQVVSQINDKLEEKISTIEIITQEEKEQLLYEFNNTECGYPREKTIQQLFEEQETSKPRKIALTIGNEFLSYQELNNKANTIANKLRENGISRDDIVIIFLDRSIETVFSMLGILKSGGAYLPIDPDYPKERIDFILKDSQSKTIIPLKNYPNK